MASLRGYQNSSGGQGITPGGKSGKDGSRQVLSDRFLLGEELGRGAYGQVGACCVFCCVLPLHGGRGTRAAWVQERDSWGQP